MPHTTRRRRLFRGLRGTLRRPAETLAARFRRGVRIRRPRLRRRRPAVEVPGAPMAVEEALLPEQPFVPTPTGRPIPFAVGLEEEPSELVEPAVITRDMAEEQVEADRAELEEMEREIAAPPPPPPAPPTPPEAPPVAPEIEELMRELEAPEETEGQRLIRETEEQLAGLDQPIDAEIEKAREEFDLLNRLSGREAAFQGTIESIKATFDSRAEAQKDINRRALEGQRVVGLVTGRARFAPAVQSGILTAEESSGMQRLADIDAQQLSLISEARQANAEQDFEVLSEIMARNRELQDEKRAELQNQLAVAKKQERIMRVQGQVADLLEQGLRSPLDMFNALGGQTSVIDIQDTINSLMPERSDIQKLIQDVAKAGGPQSIIEDMLNTDSVNEALLIGAQFLRDPAKNLDLILKRKQITKANIDIQKALGQMNGALDQKDRIALFNAEVKIKKGFESVTKDARAARTQISKIDTAFEDAQETVRKGRGSRRSINAASQVILVGFQKMLDPGSVVRESEYARSGTGLSLMGQIEGKAAKLTRGGAGVTVKDLEEFVRLGKSFLDGYENDLAEFGKVAIEQIDFIGGDMNRVLTSEMIQLLIDKGKIPSPEGFEVGEIPVEEEGLSDDALGNILNI